MVCISITRNNDGRYPSTRFDHCTRGEWALNGRFACPEVDTRLSFIHRATLTTSLNASRIAGT